MVGNTFNKSDVLRIIPIDELPAGSWQEEAARRGHRVFYDGVAHHEHTNTRPDDLAFAASAIAVAESVE